MNIHDRLDQLAIENALLVASRNAGIQCSEVHNFLHDWGWADWQRIDPGASGKLEASKVGIVDLVSKGVETRTLADPPRAGILYGINAYNVAAGNVTVTFAHAVDQAAIVNAQFAANDFLLLLSIKDSRTTTGFAWRIIVSDNPTLS